MKHKHRVLPGHMGGTYDKSNTIDVEIVACDRTTASHAMWHFANWKLWGKEEDLVAWKGLAGYWGKEKIIEELMKIGQSRIDYEKRGEAIQKSWDLHPEWRERHRQTMMEVLSRKDTEAPEWRKEHGDSIRKSGGPQRSVSTRRKKKIGMFNSEWQKEMAGRAGRSNARNGTGFCNPEVMNCPIRKARGGRASCLSRQGVKINGVKNYPESWEYRTHLSSDFVSYYVHFGMG